MAMPHYTLALLPVLTAFPAWAGDAALWQMLRVPDTVVIQRAVISGAARNRRSVHRPNSELVTNRLNLPSAHVAMRAANSRARTLIFD